MPTVHLDVTGAAQLRAALKTANAKLKVEATLANQLAAEFVVDAALPNVPRGATGNLLRSTRALATPKSGRAVSSAPYAAAIHWGRKTGNVGRPSGNRPGPNVIKGRPYLWDAARHNQPAIAAVYSLWVDRILDRL